MRRFIINSEQIRSNAAQAVLAIRGEDNLEVVIQEHNDDQTDEQRGFYHVLNGILAKELGASPNAMKMDIKRECWGSEMVTVRGHEFEVIMSTTKAKKDQYSELIECIYRVAADLGVVLPAPRGNK